MLQPLPFHAPMHISNFIFTLNVTAMCYNLAMSKTILCVCGSWTYCMHAACAKVRQMLNNRKKLCRNAKMLLQDNTSRNKTIARVTSKQENIARRSHSSKH